MWKCRPFEQHIGNAERWKAWKAQKTGFPLFPPSLEIALRFPHSRHALRRRYTPLPQNGPSESLPMSSVPDVTYVRGCTLGRDRPSKAGFFTDSGLGCCFGIRGWGKPSLPAGHSARAVNRCLGLRIDCRAGTVPVFATDATPWANRTDVATPPFWVRVPFRIAG